MWNSSTRPVLPGLRVQEPLHRGGVDRSRGRWRWAGSEGVRLLVADSRKPLRLAVPGFESVEEPSVLRVPPQHVAA